MTAAAQPAELDQILAENGYERFEGVNVQTLDLSGFSAPVATEISLEAAPRVSHEWFEAYCRLNNLTEQNRPVFQAMLAAIQPKACFLGLKDSSGIIQAVGLAVAERGYVGLFDIVTAAEMRKRGLGRQLVSALLWWAKTEAAAQIAYLQVVATNLPALKLYAKLGFQDSYIYWYRIKPF